eukprot:253333_1
MVLRNRQRTSGTRKRTWTAEEDCRLVCLVNEFGRDRIKKNWNLISQQIPGRNGKQCRERFHNQLDEKINRSPWTVGEDVIIVDKHKRFGPKWSKIASFLEGRPDNDVKNRFYSTDRKALRLVSSGKHCQDLDNNPLMAYCMQRMHRKLPSKYSPLHLNLKRGHSDIIKSTSSKDICKQEGVCGRRVRNRRTTSSPARRGSSVPTERVRRRKSPSVRAAQRRRLSEDFDALHHDFGIRCSPELSFDDEANWSPEEFSDHSEDTKSDTLQSEFEEYPFWVSPIDNQPWPFERFDLTANPPDFSAFNAPSNLPAEIILPEGSLFGSTMTCGQLANYSDDGNFNPYIQDSSAAQILPEGSLFSPDTLEESIELAHCMEQASWPFRPDLEDLESKTDDRSDTDATVERSPSSRRSTLGPTIYSTNEFAPNSVSAWPTIKCDA